MVTCTSIYGTVTVWLHYVISFSIHNMQLALSCSISIRCVYTIVLMQIMLCKALHIPAFYCSHLCETCSALSFHSIIIQP